MQKNKKIIILVVLLVVLVAAVVAFFVISDMDAKNKQQEAIASAEIKQEEEDKKELIETDTFREGVSVNGIDIGGMTMSEAHMAIDENKEILTQEISISLIHGSYQDKLETKDFDIKFNDEEILEEAFNLARDGDYDTIVAEIEALKKNGKDFKIDYEVSVNPAALSNAIADAVKAIDSPAVEAGVVVDVNASNKFTFTESSAGKVVDQDALRTEITQRAATKQYGEIVIPIKEVEPTTTAEELKANFELRGSAFTTYRNSPYNKKDRVYNVKKASSLINGTVVKPGEEFSMNDTLGPRTYALGWKPGAAIVGGRSEDQAGGGVCQVSTTLYNAVLKSDLEIVYRRAHSGKLGYIDGGLDATINTGTIDFKWRNNTDADIVVVSYTRDSDKTIHCEIYGKDFANDEYDEIRLSSKRVKTISPPGDMKTIVDSSKPNGVWIKRKSGSEWQSYIHYYKNGKEVRVEELATSVYKAYAGVTVVSSKPTEKPTEKPTSTPKPTTSPTQKPTSTPKPTDTPTQSPGTTVTPTPTEKPTSKPSEEPTEKPTSKPTKEPEATEKPTPKPTKEPEATEKPTSKPTKEPEATEKPAPKPTKEPEATEKPAPKPTKEPVDDPFEEL